MAFSCEVTKELETHLIDMYFQWEQPWCQVVNEKLFRQSLDSQGRFASPLLLSCILAAGSRFTDRLDVRADPDDPNTAGQMFIEKAEKLLYYELKWPSVTTIQSASIMGTIYLVLHPSITLSSFSHKLTYHSPLVPMPLGGCTMESQAALPLIWA